MSTKTCPECGKEFKAVLEFAEFCSGECEEAAASDGKAGADKEEINKAPVVNEELGNKLLQAVKEMKSITAADMLNEELSKIKK